MSHSKRTSRAADSKLLTSALRYVSHPRPPINLPLHNHAGNPGRLSPPRKYRPKPRRSRPGRPNRPHRADLRPPATPPRPNGPPENIPKTSPGPLTFFGRAYAQARPHAAPGGRASRAANDGRARSSLLTAGVRSAFPALGIVRGTCLRWTSTDSASPTTCWGTARRSSSSTESRPARGHGVR